MTKGSTTMTIGIDLGDRKSHVCVIDADGKVVKRDIVATTRAAFDDWFSTRPRCRVVLEASGQSRWSSRLLLDLGFEVLVANPRRLPEIYGQTRKNDPLDAERLARLGRFDPELLHAIEHRSDAAQLGLVAIKVREALVKTRTRLVTSIRGTAKMFGLRIPTCDASVFHTKATASLTEELLGILKPLVDTLGELATRIKECDKQLEELAREVYPETEQLRQVSGVGPITSLAFVLTVERPERFKRSRDIGPYLGLVPKQDQSGTIDKELGITKAGNKLLRGLLVQSAQYILGRFGPDTDLKRWALPKAEGSKAAKKRVTIALARRLAVLLHRLWVTGEEYQPLGYGKLTAE
jgi:transposase